MAVMSRSEMIGRLVAYSVEAALAEGGKHYWLSELFEKGFTGYGNFSGKQLLLEMQLRGLVPSDEPELDEDEDDDPDSYESISGFISEKEGME